jgi:hypothetical protein
MSSKSVFNERFGMLMACASPGSAVAYHLGEAGKKAEFVQRESSIESKVATPVAPRAGWLRRAMDRLEQWSWERQIRSQEAYLSQATDLCDLEARIRTLDSGDSYSRGLALR